MAWMMPAVVVLAGIAWVFSGGPSLSKLRKKKGRGHYNVYVIELDMDVLECVKFSDKNPHYEEGSLCVYVGLTGRTPEERFEQHKRGYKSCRFVKEYGLHLLPELGIYSIGYEEAKKKEPQVARALRKEGYAVWQN